MTNESSSADKERIEKTLTALPSALELGNIEDEIALAAVDSVPELDQRTVRIESVDRTDESYEIVITGHRLKPELMTDGGEPQETDTERREWPSEEKFDGTTVAATPDGANYHDDRDCRHLEGRKVELYDKSAAWYKGLDPCGDCGTWPKHELDVATDGGVDQTGTERLHVDLCTGLGGWTEPFEDADGWSSIGVDIRDDLNADVVADVRNLPLECSPDLLTMSPPCTDFARWMLPWLDEPNPSTELVEACLQAVEDLEPTWWVLENSRGLSMYWREADQNVGPYFLWGNLPPIDVTLTDGGKMSVSGESPEERAKVPYELADAVRGVVEEQRKLVTDGGPGQAGKERSVTCKHCYLTYDKHDIEEGEMTRCPRCDGLVVA